MHCDEFVDYLYESIKCEFSDSYRVYLDGTWHGEIRANATGNRSGYQYYLTDLKAGQSYDVNIKVIFGFGILFFFFFWGGGGNGKI